MMIRHVCLGFFALLMSASVLANEVALNPDHPDRYVVVKGDTLWDISAKFLQYPWHWPEIWQVNPQVENPHLIYPGDELTLVYRDGRPVLKLSRGQQTYKLSPEMREIRMDEAIHTIPLSIIRPFLTKPRVVGAEVLDAFACVEFISVFAPLAERRRSRSPTRAYARLAAAAQRVQDWRR